VKLNSAAVILGQLIKPKVSL